MSSHHHVNLISDQSDIEEAVDEGGPTRQFLSETWTQLGTLQVPKKDGSELRLFSGNEDFLQPVADAQINYLADDQKEQARLYYRAVGR